MCGRIDCLVILPNVDEYSLGDAGTSHFCRERMKVHDVVGLLVVYPGSLTVFSVYTSVGMFVESWDFIDSLYRHGLRCLCIS